MISAPPISGSSSAWSERQLLDEFPNPASTTTIATNEVACVLRNTGTFGVPGDVAATKALEVKHPDGKARAQGRLGYNVPSLYGLSLGAPYLHHGGARSLAELFDDPKWRPHAESGSAVWLRQGTADDIAARERDLINFLLSIDASTARAGSTGRFSSLPRRRALIRVVRRSARDANATSGFDQCAPDMLGRGTEPAPQRSEQAWSGARTSPCSASNAQSGRSWCTAGARQAVQEGCRPALRSLARE